MSERVISMPADALVDDWTKHSLEQILDGIKNPQNKPEGVTKRIDVYVAEQRAMGASS